MKDEELINQYSMDPSLYGIRRSARERRAIPAYGVESTSPDHPEKRHRKGAKKTKGRRKSYNYHKGNASSASKKPSLHYDDSFTEESNEESDSGDSDVAYGHVLPHRSSKRIRHNDDMEWNSEDASEAGESSDEHSPSRPGRNMNGHQLRDTKSLRAIKSYRQESESDEDNEQPNYYDSENESDDLHDKNSPAATQDSYNYTIDKVSRPSIEVVCDHRLVCQNEEMHTDSNEAQKGSDMHSVPARVSFIGQLDQSEGPIEYLIKWTGKAYIHSSWHTENEMREISSRGELAGLKKLDKYIERMVEYEAWASTAGSEELEAEEIKRQMFLEQNEHHCKVERVVDYDNKEDKYFIKWLNLGYDECTWEDAELIEELSQLEIDAYEKRMETTQKNISAVSQSSKYSSKHIYNVMSKGGTTFVPVLTSPSYITGDLRDYQLNGVNWLASNWCKGSSMILADEMGLGKTIQTISLIGYFIYVLEIQGPFLVVVPLSTLSNWQSEFKKWVPDMNVVTYLGTKAARAIIREKEFFLDPSYLEAIGSLSASAKKRQHIKFDVLLTTYEMITMDAEHISLAVKKWTGICVDEAHRLKNHQSKLHIALKESYPSNLKLLITGTPLQNNLIELWALLNFIMPSHFPSWSVFEEKYGEISSNIHQLHQDIRPFLLRRLKKDVEKSLPNKVEKILRVELSGMQREYQRHIIKRNYQALFKDGKRGSSLTNIMVELKKCCNHPFLINEPDYNENQTREQRLAEIVRNSGKLVLLDKLLLRLFETKHRVLIFSQMVRMLNVLAEYLSLRGWNFQRLDGCTSNQQRWQALEHFNKENSPDFCFLLSTKAGGLGINLTSADTVIIFDSDWNPQNDLQAEARAHRIGQKNVVSIYRLLSKDSVEEKVFDRAKQKLILDHVVIQKISEKSGKKITPMSSVTVHSSDAATNTTALPITTAPNAVFLNDEMNMLLKLGAENLFDAEKDEEADNNLNKLENQDIDEILSRSETTLADPNDPNSSSPTSQEQEFLSKFDIADFSTAEAEKEWENIIPKDQLDRLREEDESKHLLENLVEGSRSRKRVSYYQDASSLSSSAGAEGAGGHFRNQMDEDVADGESFGDHGPASSSSGWESKKSGRARQVGGAASVRKEIYFTNEELKRFIRALKKYGDPVTYFDEIVMEAQFQEKSLQHITAVLSELNLVVLQKILEERQKALSKSRPQALSSSASKRTAMKGGALATNQELDTSDPLFDSKSGQAAQQDLLSTKPAKAGLPFIQLQSIKVVANPLELIQRQIDMRTLCKFMAKFNTPNWTLKSGPRIPGAKWNVPWSYVDDSNLLKGVSVYGNGNFDLMKRDLRLQLSEKIFVYENTEPEDGLGNSEATQAGDEEDPSRPSSELQETNGATSKMPSPLGSKVAGSLGVPGVQRLLPQGPHLQKRLTALFKYISTQTDPVEPILLSSVKVTSQSSLTLRGKSVAGAMAPGEEGNPPKKNTPQAESGRKTLLPHQRPSLARTKGKSIESFFTPTPGLTSSAHPMPLGGVTTAPTQGKDSSNKTQASNVPSSLPSESKPNKKIQDFYLKLNLSEMSSDQLFKWAKDKLKPKKALFVEIGRLPEVFKDPNMPLTRKKDMFNKLIIEVGRFIEEEVIRKDVSAASNATENSRVRIARGCLWKFVAEFIDGQTGDSLIQRYKKLTVPSS